MTINHDPQRGSGLRWDGTINAGAVLQLGGLIVTVTAAFTLIQVTGAANTEKLDNTRSEMAAGFTRLDNSQQAASRRYEQNLADVLRRQEEGLRGLSQQIQTLPDLGARATQGERRMSNIEGRLDAIEGRVNKGAEDAAASRAEIQALSRIMNAPLGNGRR